jgi:uncharacterized membrane protein YkvA (DUF1232 family)
MTREQSFEVALAQTIATRLKRASEEDAEKVDVLRRLPDLYHVVWRIAFDTELPPGVRHYAASLAFYVFSGVDYIPDDGVSALSYVDDLAVVGKGLTRVIERLGAEPVLAHWRSEVPLATVLATIDIVAADVLPARIQERVEEYVSW